MSDAGSSRVFLLGRTKSEWLSCSGPCMLTFSVPLLIPGISLTIIASGDDGVVGGRVFLVLGIFALVVSSFLFLGGLTLCIFKNIKIPQSVGINDSSVTLRNDTRIYMGSNIDNSAIFQTNHVITNQYNNVMNTEKETSNINNKNYKTLNRNCSLNNGLYLKHTKSAMVKEAQLQSQSETVIALQKAQQLETFSCDKRKNIPIIHLENGSDFRNSDENVQSTNFISQSIGSLSCKVPPIVSKNTNKWDKSKIIYTSNPAC